MWHRDKKWASAVGKMATIGLFNTGLPCTFNLSKKTTNPNKNKTTAVSVRYNKMKDNKMSYACISFLDGDLYVCVHTICITSFCKVFWKCFHLTVYYEQSSHVESHLEWLRHHHLYSCTELFNLPFGLDIKVTSNLFLSSITLYIIFVHNFVCLFPQIPKNH